MYITGDYFSIDVLIFDRVILMGDLEKCLAEVPLSQKPVTPKAVTSYIKLYRWRDEAIYIRL
jgi:hypothetical protein